MKIIRTVVTAFLLLLALATIIVSPAFAGYTSDLTSTTAGTDSGGASSSVLRFEITSISNSSNYVTFRISKNDGSSFSTSGTISVRLGGGNGTIVASSSISSGSYFKSFNVYMPSYVTGTESGYFYGRYYTSSNGYWSYAGPIRIWAPSLSTPSASHSNVGTSSATLSWGSITGAMTYRYQVTASTSFDTSGDGGSCSNCVANSTTSSTSRTISGLQSLTTYRYRVRAGNSTTGQGSNWSSIGSLTTSGPSVTSVNPSSATLNQSTTFTVYGSNLTSGMGFWIADCSGVTELSGGSSTYRQFRCTPSYTVGTKSGNVKTSPGGVTLYNFSIEVSAPAPTVTSVSPTTANLGQSTTFTIYGSNLTSGMGFWVDRCDGIVELSGGSSSQRYFRCTPRWQLGEMDGVIRDEPNGILLYEFAVDVTTDIVIDELAPSRAMLGTATDFFVRGQNLPAGMGFWIDDCAGVTELGGNSTERRFRCTPVSLLGQMDGIVKDEPDGAILDTFQVEVVEPASVSGVWPQRAALGVETLFTIQGSGLPTALGFFVERCEGVVEVAGGDSTERFFRCTPSYQLGSQAGLVRVAPSGTELQSFAVDVVTEPRVIDLQPLAATLDQATTFTVTGSGLLEDMAFWIANCENVEAVAGGTATQRQFRCTPRWQTGIQDGSLKLTEKGSELWSFQVEVMGEPDITGVSPTTATIDEPTTFMVAGSDLPEGLDFELSYCEEPVELPGSNTERFFRCTPREVGSLDGTIRTAGGELLDTFTVEVSTASGVVYPDVSGWAQGAADYMVQHGIVVDPGDHLLRGQEPANRAEIATMLYRALGGGLDVADATFEGWYGGVPAPHFADVADPATWYFRAATLLGSLDFGDATAVFDPDTCVFRPAELLDRGWTTKALLSTWNQPPLGSFDGVNLFDDVPTSHPAAGWIYASKELGLVGAASNFEPDVDLMREELFVMLHRLFEDSANLEAMAIEAPTPSAADFLRLSGCRRLGYRYEQPVLRDVLVPEVEVLVSPLETATLGDLQALVVTLEATVNNLDPGVHVDTAGVEHQASPFCAWEVSGGGMRDLDPAGEPPFCRVQWIAPSEISGADGADVYRATVFVGDGLGHEIIRTVELQVDRPGDDGESPVISWDPVSPITSGQTVELTGTAYDPATIDPDAADVGLLSVVVSFSVDGGSSWEEIGPAVLEADGTWRVRWRAPRLSGPVDLRAVATNLRGNASTAQTSIELSASLVVAGLVEASSGGPVENALVTLDGGGLLSEVRSDLHGAFRFDQSIQTGVTYQLTATGPGGQTASVDEISVSVNEPEAFEVLRLDDRPPFTSASPAGGLNGVPQTVELICQDDLSGCANTYYTTDGTEPSASSNVYAGPITVGDATLKFFSVDQAGNVEAVGTETYSLPACYPPASGDWIVAESCEFTHQAVAPGDVIVEPGVVLTIAPNAILEIDLHSHKLLVRDGGGVLVKDGGTLRQTSGTLQP